MSESAVVAETAQTADVEIPKSGSIPAEEATVESTVTHVDANAAAAEAPHPDHESEKKPNQDDCSGNDGSSAIATDGVKEELHVLESANAINAPIVIDAAAHDAVDAQVTPAEALTEAEKVDSAAPAKMTGVVASVSAGRSEAPKVETTSPRTPVKPQKAAFNVDAKPFSPVSVSDPTLQTTLVGESNGLSIKIGQWSPQPFVPIQHMSPTAPVNVSHLPYIPPVPVPAPVVKKEVTAGKDSLSAYAKPWSPHPEVAVAPVVPPENEIAIHPGSWAPVIVEGREVTAPSPMVPRDSNSNLFAHSFSLHPKGLKSVELELFNYNCARCTLRTLYGRLSSRQPDVTMQNVSVDVPPLCVAHLIEQITKAKVTALHLNESEGSHYDIWLDKPNLSAQLVESVSGCVWASPMHHGYAVMGKNDEGRKYLRNYVERLRDSRPGGPNVYDVALVEVKEH
ncbi:hypothetical protein NESM_000429400 [Novymonas esmeraldas]|uniref:Uncharacterized protein n=1 Tax=Novymonas esmeraldas TaxID=1808958 RepID=A0AAW0EQ06_9TRYP